MGMLTMRRRTRRRIANWRFWKFDIFKGGCPDPGIGIPLDSPERSCKLLAVRKLKTSIVVSAAMLAAAHAFATLEVAPTRNLQAAEAQAQETVKLSISGMT